MEIRGTILASGVRMGSHKRPGRVSVYTYMSPSVGLQSTPEWTREISEEGFERIPSVIRDLELAVAKLILGLLHLAVMLSSCYTLPSFQ